MNAAFSPIYEAAVQHEMTALARKTAELRALLNTALDMLVVLGRLQDGSTRRAVLDEVDAMRAAADAIRDTR